MSITHRESTDRLARPRGRKPQKFTGTVTTQGKPRPGRENQRKTAQSKE